MPTTANVASIRTGAFDQPDDVEEAIAELRRAGFRTSEIKVVTADDGAARRFASYIDQQPSGARTSKALSRAALVYSALAALGVVAALFTGPSVTLIVVCALLGVALLATFGFTMMTRGAERELSDFYSQGIIPGQLLLAVELPEDAPPDKIAAADRVFDRFTGTHTPLDLE